MGASAVITAPATQLEQPESHPATHADAAPHYVSEPGVSLLALRELLLNRRVALLWDLDNVDFFAPASSAPLQLRRMQELVAAAGGRLAMCRAYANYDTAQRLRGVLPLLERWRLMDVALVPVRADAADMRLVQDAMAFASAAASSYGSFSYEDSSSGSDSDSADSRRHGSSMHSDVAGGEAWGGELQPAVLCVSQDTDFAEPLRHLSERGVVTIAISPHEPRRRTHAAMEPATYFRRLPLPSACCAALQWRAQPPAPVSAAEAAWLEARLQPQLPPPQPDPEVSSRASPQATTDVRQPAQHRLQQPGDGLESGSGGRAWTTGGAAMASGTQGEEVAQQVAVVRGGTTPEAGNTTCVEQGAVAVAAICADTMVPRGLVEFVREGHPCPGAATRLWLNPAFVGT